MPTIGHVAVGMALGRAHAGSAPPAAANPWRLAAFGALALWPDLDMFGHAAGVPHLRWYGHRGFTHSFAAAALAALLFALWARRAGWAGPRVLPFALLAAASHGLLDTLTDFGVGPALLWPLTNARFLAPVRPVPATSLLSRFVTWRGALITAAETAVVLPLFAYALVRRR